MHCDTLNCGYSDDGGKVQLNNQRDAASRHSSICSYRAASPHQSFSFYPASRRASSVSRYSAAGDVSGSRDSRKPSIARGPSRQNSVTVVGGGGGGGGNMRAQTSVGSASLDEYQHNDLVGDANHREKNRVRVTLKDNEELVDDTACVADIVRTHYIIIIIVVFIIINVYSLEQSDKRHCTSRGLASVFVQHCHS